MNDKLEFTHRVTVIEKHKTGHRLEIDVLTDKPNCTVSHREMCTADVEAVVVAVVQAINRTSTIGLADIVDRSGSPATNIRSG